ncbi:hypothetical protein GIB67_019138 [Kingdonia uniflora]|uniref:Uncharacterized protein n=1 Tax=Kingdonia uniflora TaxID=39325 RepID=A0A7J7MZJ3_9MAGN|nr:hypothetical protein GIB67_019138 [Kingdonia uniflora]
MANSNPNWGFLTILTCMAVMMISQSTLCGSTRSDKEMRERFYGNMSLDSSPPDSGEGSIAKIFDRVLEKEFSDNDQPDGPDPSSFNSSVADQQVGVTSLLI